MFCEVGAKRDSDLTKMGQRSIWNWLCSQRGIQTPSTFFRRQKTYFQYFIVSAKMELRALYIVNVFMWKYFVSFFDGVKWDSDLTTGRWLIWNWLCVYRSIHIIHHLKWFTEDIFFQYLRVQISCLMRLWWYEMLISVKQVSNWFEIGCV